MVRAICLVLVCLLAVPAWGSERINALLIGKVNGHSDLEVLFGEEPLIDFVSVPALDQGWGMANNIKYVRQYFPRTYDQLGDIDLLMFLTAEYYLSSPQQDQWMHDRIAEGAGGYNDESVMAIWAAVADSWANSIVQEAFPNDAPAVVARPGGFDSPTGLYRVEIEEDFADPVFTPYIRYGVERFLAHAARLVIPRQGTDLMLWNVNGFLWGKTPRMIVWDYKEGRAITDGGCVGDPREAFLGRDNPYGSDMVVNMVLYATKRRLIEDTEVYHHIKGMFSAFDSRLGYLISLMDFVERFGANTEVLQIRIMDLRGTKWAAMDRYLESDFRGTQEAMLDALDAISDAEMLARKVKNSALWWVYLIEWFITTSTLMVSGLLVWTLMVRRRFYRSVSSTRMREARQE